MLNFCKFCYFVKRFFIFVEFFTKSDRSFQSLRHKYKIININTVTEVEHKSWWRHQIETFSALLAFCAGNSPVPGEFPTQRPVTRSFGVFFDLRPNNGWVNNREASDLRRYRHHYDVIVMSEFVLTIDPPYLALTGELWSVYCEDWGVNWPCFNGIALYITSFQ